MINSINCMMGIEIVIHIAKSIIFAGCIELCSQTNEEAAKILKPYTKETVGRPRLEVDQPGIIEAILDIVQVASVSDEITRTVKTLSDLNSELLNLRFNFSKSATYYRRRKKLFISTNKYIGYESINQCRIDSYLSVLLSHTIFEYTANFLSTESTD